jgi:hypothetical protein
MEASFEASFTAFFDVVIASRASNRQDFRVIGPTLQAKKSSLFRKK